MQSARSSDDTNAVQCTATPDIVLIVHQLAAKVHEQDELIEGFQLHMSQVHQSVADLPHHILWLKHMQQCSALTRHQQIAIEYAENCGILPLYRDPTEFMSQQQQQLQQPQAELASVVAQQHHQHYQSVSAVEEAHVSSIPDPPPPTPAHQQVEFCYAPRILNAREVEQGRFEKAIVYYQENNNTIAVRTAQDAVAPVTDPSIHEPELSDLLEIPPEVVHWGIATWGLLQEENYRQ
ncbi:hypothetical protein NADE_003555 [Nannochloris sp. 'desiccata']|nr:hypothetical protein KSW81_000420 [Chlorella desiccata (nom. nud.)]KAH7620946.1 hypothetical protein NADE_003555 [Chlorella desiccata (nom. nud.)]